MSKAVTLCSASWDPLDSYGKIATALSLHLKSRGYHVNELGDNGNQDSKPSKLVPVLGGIFLGYPTGLDVFPDITLMGKRIMITMFESTKIPETWLEPLSKMQKIILPSQWCYNVFKDNGVDPVKMVVAPLGIGDEFQFYLRELRGPIKFLTFADRGRRKGWDRALKAFLDAFGPEDMSVELTIKMRHRTDGFSLKSTYPNVKVVMEDLWPEELPLFYAKYHVVVLPGTGEGFGWIPREFSATGGLAVVTDFSASSEDIDVWGGIPIKYKEVPAWPYHQEFDGLGVWADPDLGHLTEIYLDIKKNFKDYMVTGLDRSERTREHYPWSNFFQIVEDAWQR